MYTIGWWLRNTYLCFVACALQPIAGWTDARDVTFPSQASNSHPFFIFSLHRTSDSLLLISPPPWASLKSSWSLKPFKEPAQRLKVMGSVMLFLCFRNRRYVCHANWATKTNIEEFINSLRQLWAHIPSKTRRSIGRRPDQGFRSSRKRLKPPNKSRITIPHAFTAKLHLWESDPLLFFTEDSGISLDFGRDSLAGSYNYISRLERRTETDTIRLRLWKVTYYRLKERLCLNYLRTDNMETVAQIISRSGMTEDESDLIKQRVSRWTDEGRRIDALCRDINRADYLDDSHLGTLFCLPQDIPDELWVWCVGILTNH